MTPAELQAIWVRAYRLGWQAGRNERAAVFCAGCAAERQRRIEELLREVIGVLAEVMLGDDQDLDGVA